MAGPGYTFLIMDDHENMRKGVRRALNDGQNKFFEASNTQAALKIFYRQNIDLILADIFIDTREGFELLTEVRSSHKQDVPVIVITGEAGRDEIVRAVSAGANAVLIKPFQPGELAKKIKEILDAYFHPSENLAKLRDAEVHIHAERFQEGQRILEDLVENKVRTSRVLHDLGEIQFLQGNFEQAIAYYLEATEQNDDYFRSHARIGDIYIRLGNEQEAIYYIEQELRVNPQQLGRLTYIAKLFHKHENPVAAQKYFQMALQIDARNYDTVLWAGRNYTKLGNLEKAIQYFKRAERINDSATQPITGRVEIYVRQESYKQAFSVVNEKIKHYASNPEFYLLRSTIYLAQDELVKALADLTTAYKLNSKNTKIVSKMITVSMRLKQYPKAVKYYKKLIALSPNDPVIMKRLAGVYALINMPREGIKMMLKALILAPDDGDGFLSLGQLYRRTGQIDKAKQAVRKAKERGVQPKSKDLANRKPKPPKAG